MTRRTISTKIKYEVLKTDVHLSSSEEGDGETSAFKPEAKNTSFKLKRNIGIFSGVCVVVNMMIGSGIFVVPTGVLKYCNGDVKLSILIWGIGGVLCMIASLCVCELGASITESGSSMTFLHHAFGSCASFLFAWMMVVIANPEGLAAQMIALGDYMTRLHFNNNDDCEFPNAEVLKKLLGMLVASVIFAINIRSVKFALKLHILCALGKVVALIGISFVGLYQLFTDRTVARKNFLGDKIVNLGSSRSTSDVLFTPGIGHFSLALYQGLWAYDGFEAVTIVTEEVKNPKRSLPIIMFISIPLVTFLYMIVNVAYFSVLTTEEMLASNAVAVSFGLHVHPFMAYLMTFSVCLSLIGSINGNFLAIARIPFVAGRLGLMPQVLSMAHVKYYSPSPAIFFSMALGVMMIFPSNFNVLVTANMFIAWAFRGLSYVGLLYLRKKRKDLERPYKVYTTTAIAAIAISCYLVVVPLVFQPNVLYLLSIVILLLLSGIYTLISKDKIRMTGIGIVSLVLQKLLLVAPTS